MPNRLITIKKLELYILAEEYWLNVISRDRRGSRVELNPEGNCKLSSKVEGGIYHIITVLAINMSYLTIILMILDLDIISLLTVWS